MNFLTKLAKLVARGVTGIQQAAPVIKVLFPKVAPVVDRTVDTSVQIGGIVAQTQIIGEALKLPGAAKLTAATPAVTTVILQSDLLAGRHIKDQARFAAGVAKVTEGWVDILDSLDPQELPDVPDATDGQ